jgi:hypothetical protein
MATKNIKQVQNAQVMERKKFRLGRGGFYNLHLGTTQLNYMEITWFCPAINAFVFLQLSTININSLVLSFSRD